MKNNELIDRIWQFRKKVKGVAGLLEVIAESNLDIRSLYHEEMYYLLFDALENADQKMEELMEDLKEEET